MITLIMLYYSNISCNIILIVNIDNNWSLIIINYITGSSSWLCTILGNSPQLSCSHTHAYPHTHACTGEWVGLNWSSSQKRSIALGTLEPLPAPHINCPSTGISESQKMPESHFIRELSLRTKSRDWSFQPLHVSHVSLSTDPPYAHSLTLSLIPTQNPHTQSDTDFKRRTNLWRK